MRCCGKWSSPSTLLSLPPKLLPETSTYPTLDTHIYAHVSGQRSGLVHRITRILNLRLLTAWTTLVFCQGLSCAL